MPCNRPFVIGALFSLLLTACGGGGGGSGGGTPTPAPEPDPAPTEAMINSASRLAARASFGLAYETIESIAIQGEQQWLAEQFATPIGLHVPIVDELLARQAAGDFAPLAAQFDNLEFAFRRLAWWQQAVNANDDLRQRVAFALSEIFVVSDQVDVLTVYPYALSSYYDVLLSNAFGNYRDLLKAVSLHPAMGVFLSHVNNARANPAANTFPDENYAREVMQLFSIGLFELNPDGSEKTDSSGRPVATYNNDTIREFAKIFTGLSYGGPAAFFGKQQPVFQLPMQMFDNFHDNGEKRLLNNVQVSAGQTGEADIEAAIDNLFNHPNVGPFIGKQLIQRLVTSNPSADYIARVSSVFADDGNGIRGNMQALIQAILLDPEALADHSNSAGFGKLREPLLRTLAMLRQLNVSSPDGFFANTGYALGAILNQHPLSSPSVFNFFLPSHSPIGALSDAGLVAPEFQITNSNTIVTITNIADFVLFGEAVNDLTSPPFSTATIDYSDYIALAANPAELLDRLDATFTYGGLSEDTRELILDTITPLDDNNFRAITALYLLFTSADYAVQL